MIKMYRRPKQGSAGWTLLCQAGCSNTTNTRKCCCVRSSGEGCYPGWLKPVQQTHFVTSGADRISVFGLLAMALHLPCVIASLINTKSITLFKIHVSSQ